VSNRPRTKGYVVDGLRVDVEPADNELVLELAE
jgi:hypothetical protein